MNFKNTVEDAYIWADWTGGYKSGSDSMKRKNAKEILAESFQELAREKKIDKITVKEIADNCGYSTVTFYRQFKDKYDLIAWDYTRQTARLMEQVGQSGYKWQQTLGDGLLYYQEQKEYLVNLLRHTSGHESFIRYMSEAHYNALTAYVKKLTGAAQLDKKTDMYIYMFCLGSACLNCEWILGKIDATKEEIAEVLEKSVPEPLWEYLIKE